MCSDEYSLAVILFFIYSALGWICSTVYSLIRERKFTRHGFLFGPYAFAYGAGATLILAASAYLKPWPPLIFLASGIIGGGLEFLTHWLVEKIFGVRWRDYRNKKLSLFGRTYWFTILLFAILGTLLTYFIHPFVLRCALFTPAAYRRVIASIIVSVLVIDLVATLSSSVRNAQKINRIATALTTLQAKGISNDVIKTQTLRITSHPEDEENSLPAKPSLAKRIARAMSKKPAASEAPPLPEAPSSPRADEAPQTAEFLFKQIRADLRAIDYTRGKFREYIALRAPHVDAAHAFVIDLTQSYLRLLEEHKTEEGKREKEAVRSGTKSFAAGLNFYKLWWVFIIGSVIGYIVETIYCFAVNGTVESRQGLIYGPFNPVYGFGAILMVVLLRKALKKGDLAVFVGSALIGGVFEAGISYIQELLFGSVSWEYSGTQGALFNGRTSLFFMAAWGVLGLFCLKYVFPRMFRMIERIPNKPGVVITWVLVVLLVCDAGISAAAVLRWGERIEGHAPKNAVAEFLDARYPDALMEEVYPNMTFRTVSEGNGEAPNEGASPP